MNTPFLSIVIPTFNRPRQLSKCLEALNRIEYSRHCFEVIIVDDGGSANLDSTLQPWRDSLNIVLLQQNNAGPAMARNTGAAQARGDFLVFTDDDCQPAPNWLAQLAERFAHTPKALVGGRTLNALPHNPYSSASQLLIDFIYDFYNVRSSSRNEQNGATQKAQFFTSNNFAVNIHEFRAFGGFETRYTRAAAEDREFCDRWLRSGRPMIYAPEVVIRHAHLLNPRSLWRQHFNYGCGAWQFHRARANQVQGFKPDPRFYLSLIAYPFTQRLTFGRQVMLCALLLYIQVANLCGYLAERRRHLR